ncbi:hypothetical protein D3C71_1711260 [compost metagenome]
MPISAGNICPSLRMEYTNNGSTPLYTTGGLFCQVRCLALMLFIELCSFYKDYGQVTTSSSTKKAGVCLAAADEYTTSMSVYMTDKNLILSFLTK